MIIGFFVLCFIAIVVFGVISQSGGTSAGRVDPNSNDTDNLILMDQLNQQNINLQMMEQAASESMHAAEMSNINTINDTVQSFDNNQNNMF